MIIDQAWASPNPYEEEWEVVMVKKSNKRLRQKIIEDLEAAYKGALECGNFMAAIKAKELQAKELARAEESFIPDFSSLTDEELSSLLKALEAEMPQ